ncbi:MAG TPA: hypothetical protein PKC21_07305 [Oligoflexia bacterium]|nr:hypothetical protein [Oligoflexia bacterium]HMR25144.1 hypothetical protein [Oligoflexia bacterium]
MRILIGCILLFSSFLSGVQACENINLLSRKKNQQLIDYLATEDSGSCLDLLLESKKLNYQFKHLLNETYAVVWENIFTILESLIVDSNQLEKQQGIILNNVKYIQLFKRKRSLMLNPNKKDLYYLLRQRQYIDQLFAFDNNRVNDSNISSEIYKTLFYIGFENESEIIFFNHDYRLDLIYFLSQGIVFYEKFSEYFIDKVFYILETIPFKYQTEQRAENWNLFYSILAQKQHVLYRIQSDHEKQIKQEKVTMMLLKVLRELDIYSIFSEVQRDSISNAAKTLALKINSLSYFSQEVYVEYFLELISLYYAVTGKDFEKLIVFEDSIKSMCDQNINICREKFEKEGVVSRLIANYFLKQQAQEDIFQEHILEDLNGKVYSATCSLEYIEKLKNHLLTTKQHFNELFFEDFEQEPEPISENLQDFILFLFKSHEAYCSYVSRLESNYDYAQAEETAGLCSKEHPEHITLYACISKYQTEYTVAKHEYVHYLQKLYFYSTRWVNVDLRREDTGADRLNWLSEGSADYLAYDDNQERVDAFCSEIDQNDLDTWTITNLINKEEASRQYYSISALFIMFLNDYDDGVYQETIFKKIRNSLRFGDAEDDEYNIEYSKIYNSKNSRTRVQAMLNQRDNSYIHQVKPLLEKSELQTQFSEFIKEDVCKDKF